jgi:hypothetical protein
VHRLLTGTLILALWGVAVFTLQPAPWVTFLTAAAIAVAGWRLVPCRHPGPLGLLPPRHDGDAEVPARWFCDKCGRSWPAQFERDHHPIYRFAGYDPNKAKAAARRADELLRQQRALAVRRAGLAVRRADTRARRAESADVVPILDGRRFGR